MRPPPKCIVEQLGDFGDTEACFELGNGVANVSDDGALLRFGMLVTRLAYPPKGSVDVRAGVAGAKPAKARAATIEKRILAVIKYQWRYT